MTKLSDLVSEANREHGWSTREISHRASKAGQTISHGTAGKVLNGTHGKVELATINALHAVFGTPVAALIEAAGLRTPLGPYTPPQEAVMLSERQRSAISELIRSIVASAEGEAGGTVIAGDFPPAPSGDEQTAVDVATQVAQAARKGKSSGRRSRAEQDRDAESGGA